MKNDIITFICKIKLFWLMVFSFCNVTYGNADLVENYLKKKNLPTLAIKGSYNSYGLNSNGNSLILKSSAQFEGNINTANGWFNFRLIPYKNSIHGEDDKYAVSDWSLAYDGEKWMASRSLPVNKNEDKLEIPYKSLTYIYAKQPPMFPVELNMIAYPVFPSLMNITINSERHGLLSLFSSKETLNQMEFEQFDGERLRCTIKGACTSEEIVFASKKSYAVLSRHSKYGLCQDSDRIEDEWNFTNHIEVGGVYIPRKTEYSRKRNKNEVLQKRTYIIEKASLLNNVKFDIVVPADTRVIDDRFKVDYITSSNE